MSDPQPDGPSRDRDLDRPAAPSRSFVLFAVAWNVGLGGSFILTLVTGVKVFLAPILCAFAVISAYGLRHPEFSWSSFTMGVTRPRGSRELRMFSNIFLLAMSLGGLVALLLDAVR